MAVVTDEDLGDIVHRPQAPDGNVKPGIPVDRARTLNAGKKRKRTTVNGIAVGNGKHLATTSPTGGPVTWKTKAVSPIPMPAINTHSASGPRSKRETLLEFRRGLPIWPKADLIRAQLRKHDVLILVGETGSGKSTQVPQFLLQESWCRGKIAITQPRRVAAISLARRVADEMGSPLGAASPKSKVGYSVRFDKSVSPSTRILYLTEGMLLQDMLRDPALKSVSAVIVDEVHERSVNVDLLLGFLRNLITINSSLRKQNPLKVIVMSATANVTALTDFFEQGYSVQQLMANASSVEPAAAPKSESSATQAVGVGVCHIEGRLFPVHVTYLPTPTDDFVEAALKCVFQIHYKEPLPGDILVFLTGQDTVESLERLINDYAETLGPEVPKVMALPLFAALPQHAQQKVFEATPAKTRKIILSTNIAETSVTVPGIRFVIDSGKMKVKQFRNRLGLDSLLVKPVSKSSAIQRKGRAGREAAGQCFRLYTEQDYKSLQKDTTPEILRCDLSDALLGMKARGVHDVVNFPFLDSPSRESLEKSLLQLLQLGALNSSGDISEMGLQMARLPLTPSLGRTIMEASKTENKCLLDVIDIIACLSVETIFINVLSEERKEEAAEARKELLRRDGDHLTLLATVRGYAAERTDRKAWAQKYFVSHRAMQNVMDIRKQLFQQCKQMNLLSEAATLDSDDYNFSEERNARIIRCLLHGFATNTARLMPDGSYKTLAGNQTVAIHPSSVLFGRRVEAILFSEFVFTSKSYGRNVSVIRLAWIDEVLAAQ